MEENNKCHSYLDLEKEVWNTGKCAGCGACTAVCPADVLYFKTGEESLHPVNSGYCKASVDGIECGACYQVCPRVKQPQEETIGNYLEIIAARSNISIPKKQSGGAVTAILANALEQGMVDAVVTVAEDPWTLKPSSILITSAEVLIEHAGSRYNWWVPLLSSLKKAVIKKKYRNIAIIGVPCVIEAIQRMQKCDHDLIRPFSNSIKLTMGLFCSETFDYEKLIEGKLKKELHIRPWQIEQMDISGKLVILLENGEKTSIPLSSIENCVRPGCSICTDLTAPDADISAGSIGSEKGYTTLIVRNAIGEIFVKSALSAGKLEICADQVPDIDMIEKLAKKKITKGLSHISANE